MDQVDRAQLRKCARWRRLSLGEKNRRLRVTAERYGLATRLVILRERGVVSPEAIRRLSLVERMRE